MQARASKSRRLVSQMPVEHSEEDGGAGGVTDDWEPLDADNVLLRGPTALKEADPDLCARDVASEQKECYYMVFRNGEEEVNIRCGRYWINL